MVTGEHDRNPGLREKISLSALADLEATAYILLGGYTHLHDFMNLASDYDLEQYHLLGFIAFFYTFWVV